MGVNGLISYSAFCGRSLKTRKCKTYFSIFIWTLNLNFLNYLILSIWWFIKINGNRIFITLNYESWQRVWVTCNRRRRKIRRWSSFHSNIKINKIYSFFGIIIEYVKSIFIQNRVIKGCRKSNCWWTRTARWTLTYLTSHRYGILRTLRDTTHNPIKLVC